MKSLWFYYLQSFKDIVSHGTIFTTLILSVLFYSFFIQPLIKAQQAEALPIITVDEEQSNVSTHIIGQVAQSPNVEVRRLPAIFPRPNNGWNHKKPMVFYFYPNNFRKA